jgi:hypothetical protein
MRFSILLLIILFASCNTLKKQKRTAENYYLIRPQELAKNCAEKYPPIVTIKPGEITVKSDTTYIKGDSIPCPPVVNAEGEKVYVKVKCPDSKIIHDTIKSVDTFFTENTALTSYLIYKTDSLSIALIKTNTGFQQSKTQASIRLWMLIAACACIVTLIVFIIKK